MRSIMIMVSVIILLFCFTASLFSLDTTPKPYTKDEFPEWALDLRRAEIILVGSLPFTMFFSLESYDLYRYFSHGLTTDYLPWPVKSTYGVPYSMEEKLGVVIGALSLSLVITIVDYVIGKVFPRDESPY